MGKCYGLLNPLGKEVKQERNLRARKKNKNKNNEKAKGGEKEEEIRIHNCLQLCL